MSENWTEPDFDTTSAIPKMGCGLYQVAHEPEMANVATEVLTWDLFHHQMGHEVA